MKLAILSSALLFFALSSARPNGPPGGCMKKDYNFRSPHRAAASHDVLLSASALGGDSYLLKIDQSAQSILGLRVLPDVDGEFVNNYPTFLSDSGSNNRCLGHSTRLGGIDSVIELEYKSVGGVPKFDVILMSNSLQYSRETVAVE